MNVRNRRHTWIFLTVAGACFFGGGLVFDSFFSTPLPLVRDACIEDLEAEGPAGTLAACQGLYGDVQVLTYFHDQDMRGRNEGWLVFTALLGVGLALVTFRERWSVPAPDGRSRYFSDAGRKVTLGLVVAIAIPWALALVLPNPDGWLPRSLVEIERANTTEARRSIVKKAQALEAALASSDTAN